MEIPQNKKLIHFSKIAFVLSLVFIITNIFWFGLYLQSTKTDFRQVAPQIVFGKGQTVSLKTPVGSKFVTATPNQPLLTGSYIKTDDQSYAEIQVNGSKIRLDKNTELKFAENKFNKRDPYRYAFELQKGSVWVNAFDPIVIKTPFAQAKFDHTIGAYMYSKPLNRVFSVIGNSDVRLMDSNKKPLASITLPLKNQITFSDSQLISDYSRIKYSKLKKELKMGAIQKSILDESWIQMNTKNDANIFTQKNNYINNAGSYHFQNRYHSIKSTLALTSEQKEYEKLELAKIKLNYLLGGLHLNNDSITASTVLDEFNTIANDLRNNAKFNNIIENEFYRIRNVKTNSPAYLTKEALRQYLFAKNKNPEIFKTYLADIDYLFRIRDLKQVDKIAANWLKKWTTAMRKKHSDEFNRQARIYHSILLAYPSKITTKTLGVLDSVGDYRMKNDSSLETLYEIALERLDISKYLMNTLRYSDAKKYLKTSYAKLNLSKQKSTVAAKDIFVKEAVLIADRIDFTEQTMHGAAKKIDEKKFQDYLTIRKRNKSIEQRFNSFLKNETQKHKKSDEIYFPTVKDVSKKLALSRVVALESDIIAYEQDPFEFKLKTASLLDKAKSGSTISFSSKYDYSTNSVYEIKLKGKKVEGGYSLSDFIKIAKTNKKVLSPQPSEKDEILDFLNFSDVQNDDRNQVVAQDLAVQLMIKELKNYNILVSNSKQVEVVNPATLTEFALRGVYVEELVKKRKVKVDFKYNTVSKTMTDVVVHEETSSQVPNKISASNFNKTIFKGIYGKEQSDQAVDSVVKELENLGLTLNKDDFDLEDGNLNKVNFRKVRMKIIPIEFSGAYDRSDKKFIEAKNELLNSKNIKVNTYLTKLSELWIIDYLSSKGIHITKSHITTQMPSSKVSIKNYIRGTKVLSFTFDISKNNLTDVSLIGVSGKTSSMSFDEFALIGE